MRRREQKAAIPFFFWMVAILAHVYILRLTVSNSSKVSDKLLALRDKAIEVVSPKELEGERKPVVQTSQLKVQQDIGQTANHSGEFRNRVKEETRALGVGRFRQGKLRPEVATEPPSPGEGEESVPKMEDLLAFGQSPEALSKDMKVGAETVLNTDKVMYASFINRIADEIYQPWVREAENAVHDLYLDNKKIDANDYVTRLKVTMDSEGSVKSIQVLESSGIPELDEAPKKAFWQTEPFPNPPSQLFDKDGYMRLTYEFQFEWKSSGFNIVPWRI